MHGAPGRVRTITLTTSPPRVAIATAVMVMLGMALLGAMVVNTVDAAPIKTNVGMEKRKAIHEESCKDLDGKFDFVEYHNGAEPVLRTSCSFSDGSTTTCTHTPTTMDCRSRTDRVIATWTPADPVGFPETTAPTPTAVPDEPATRPTIEPMADLPQEVNPDLAEPTLTAVPQGPTLQPTLEPAPEPRR